jgi:energy-coupling factor transporter transmembrane protein EcfT
VHPSLRILTLIILAIALQFIQGWMLYVMGMLVIVAAFVLYPVLCRRMLVRSRWLMLTLLLIFSFTTPGEYVRGWSSGIAPTYEGIGMGLLQAGRLTVMLAGLALLLGSTGREALMSGIYLLMQPLQVLGISPARFAVRLWLTLHYVEQAPEKTRRFKWSMLNGVGVDDHAELPMRLVLTMPALTWIDGLVLAVAGAFLIGWLV